MFLDYCNGGDLKELLEAKDMKLHPEVIRTIMQQLFQGFFDMVEVLVIHRDLKL
jgi:serine/threonine protein kinase